MKITIEWKDGDSWKQVNTEMLNTRNNNCAAKHNGTILVFPNLQEGTEVVSPTSGKWIKVGRVTRNHTIFLGNGQSYAEHCESLFQGDTGKSKEYLNVCFSCSPSTCDKLTCPSRVA